MTEGGAGAGGMGRQQEGRGQRNVHKHMQHGAMQQGCARAGSCHTMRKRKAEVHKQHEQPHSTPQLSNCQLRGSYLLLFYSISLFM